MQAFVVLTLAILLGICGLFGLGVAAQDLRRSRPAKQDKSWKLEPRPKKKDRMKVVAFEFAGIAILLTAGICLLYFSR